MYFEIVYAGGNTMKLEEIKRMARENEVVAYFKALYKHSVQLLESIPDAEISEMLSKNVNGRDVDEKVLKMHPKCKIEDFSYRFGIPNGFIFGNPSDDYWIKDINKVFMEVEYVGSYGEDEYLEPVAGKKFESTFDYRFMYMKLYLGTDEVYFEVADCNYDDELNEEDEYFLRSLKYDDFLNRIFGEYLIHNFDNNSFVVSSKFFEE